MTDDQAYKDSLEARFRRETRTAIKDGPFTKSERDIILAFVNHWFHHRRSTKGIVHPGREKLAKKAGVTIKSVSRCLDFLRKEGVIEATAHLNGLHGNATEYAFNAPALMTLCKGKRAEKPYNGGTNVPTQGRDKMSHRSCDVIAFPSQGKAVRNA